MSGSQSSESQASGTVVRVVLAWVLVGIPLLWGVAMTARNAVRLFQ